MEYIKEIYSYYYLNRGVGHTTELMRGINKNCLIVTNHHKMSDHIKRYYNHKNTITLGQISNGGLRGNNSPLLIDNSAIHTILENHVDLITENNQLKKKINKLKRIINE